ncbi:MAG: phenylacetate--CoA ligase family protein [Chloroflexota bacterium]
MSDAEMTHTRFRQRLPLGWRMSYGWLKRHLTRDRLWHDPVFNQWHQWLRQTENWSLPALQSYQLRRLKALLHTAYTRTPFYRQLYDSHGVTPDDIQSLDDLSRLPIITKSMIRENIDAMLPDGTNRENLVFLTTSGSTGQPVGVFQDAGTVDQVELAFIHRQWAWAGYRRGNAYATFRGQVIRLQGPDGHPTLWDYLTEDNRLMLLAQDTADSTMRETVRLLRRFRPRFIQTYPSTLELIVRYIQREGLDDIDVQAVFCESETLYPHQRRLFEQQFKAQVFGAYGHSERALDAVECEAHSGYHVNMEYGILELLDEHNRPITVPGRWGKVVGTGLDTFAMPLIRYETDDLAAYAAAPCPCGRAHTLIEDFHGRTPDYIVSHSGQVYPFGPIYASAGDEIPEIWHQIRELRFIQRQPGLLTIEMALVPGSDAECTKVGFLKGLYAWIKSSEFTASVDVVDAVQRNPRGKIRLLEQHLQISPGDLSENHPTATTLVRDTH